MELTDIRLRSVMQWDPIKGTFEQSHNLKYFRQPSRWEYPLDLNRGFDAYVHREGVYPGSFDQVQKYLMQVDRPKQTLQETDFILHRRTLYVIMEGSPVSQFSVDYRFVAFRFKGCIFIKLINDTEQGTDIRFSYAFKARQYLMTDRLGEAPDSNIPIDERLQQYGMFTARVGQFRLLYSGELTGLSNTEPLGDLTDQQELDKCRLTFIRVVKPHVAWRNSFRYAKWVKQGYLSGGDQIVVAKFNNQGKVLSPIEVDSMENLLKRKSELDIEGGVQRIHQFLERIKRKLEDLDNPAASIQFSICGQSLTIFEALDRSAATIQLQSPVFEKELNTEFMDYVNQL